MASNSGNESVTRKACRIEPQLAQELDLHANEMELKGNEKAAWAFRRSAKLVRERTEQSILDLMEREDSG